MLPCSLLLPPTAMLGLYLSTYPILSYWILSPATNLMVLANLSSSSSCSNTHVLLQEYGLPSSHTMNSLVLNFFIVHYLLDKHMVPAEWALTMYLGTAVWVAWVGLARVYMGLHTPIDIGAGALLGTLVLVFYLAVDGTFLNCPLAVECSVACEIASRLLNLTCMLELRLLAACLLASSFFSTGINLDLLSGCWISGGKPFMLIPNCALAFCCFLSAVLAFT